MPTSNRILALDIGASNLKLAEFSAVRPGAFQLVKYAISALGLDPQDEGQRSAYVVTTLQEMLAEHQIKAGPVLLSVSGQSVFSRYVKLPPVEKEKVYQIVQYEAQQNVPFPMEEVVWDYQLIGGHDAGEVDVMLAAIKGEIIEEITDCVSFAGLRPELIDVAPMTLYNAVRYNYGAVEGCVLIIDIGARSTDLVFMEEGRVFSRSIPVAGNAITQQIMRAFEISFADAEELKLERAFVGGGHETPVDETAEKISKSVRSVMTRMHAEINRSVNFYRSQQNGSRPELVLLTGGTSILPHSDSFFKEKLKMEIEYLNPFQNVEVSDAISSEAIGETAHLLGEVVGLALRETLTCPIELNLMPPKVLAEKAFRKKQPVLLGAMAGTVCVQLVWCGYFFKMAQLRREGLDEVQTKVNALTETQSKLMLTEERFSATKKKLKVVGDLLIQRTRWLEVLDAIRTELPDGIWLSSIQPVYEEEKAEPVGGRARRGRSRRDPRAQPRQEEKKPKTIKALDVSGLGYRDKVRSDAILQAFRDRLRASDFFAAETEFTSKPPPAPDDLLRRFSMRIELEPAEGYNAFEFPQI